MRPFLKWAGGKYAIRQHILDLLPNGKRLIEPFAGAGAIFLNSHYESYLIGEKNNDLILLYQFLQKEGLDFIHDAKGYFTPKNNCVEKYMAFRKKFNDLLEKPKKNRERALLFLYLNRHGYNGLCRYNSTGGYNVPFGRYSSPFFPEKAMKYFYEKSQNAVFKYADFRETLEEAQTGDIVYCDPPYVPLSKTAYFSSYIKDVFSEQEQKDLATMAKKLARQGIPVIISNHDTQATREYYKHAKIIQLDVPRLISRDINNRQKTSEIIAFFE